MRRPESTMTAAELQEWRARWNHTLASGSDALGVSVPQFKNYLAGRQNVPITVALLADALDTIDKLERRLARVNGTKGE